VTNHTNLASQGKDDLIAATLLMDPIPFLLHYPAVAYNFVYRQPRRANEWQLWYFASRDADIARALSRHFFWFECVLFREDVLLSSAGTAFGRENARRKPASISETIPMRRHKPMPVAVTLAGRDQIVDAPAVHAYLTGGSGSEEQSAQVVRSAEANSPSRWAKDELEVLYFPELDHATVFDTPRRRAPLLEVLRRFVRLEEVKSEDGVGTPHPPAVGRLVDVE
jgi:hypothetical protein